MIIASLKSITCDEIDNIDKFRPNPELPFSFSLVLTIGSVDSNGGDNFRVRVRNVHSVSQSVQAETFVRGFGCIIVDSFDIDQFERYVTSYISNCHGLSWLDVVQQLVRIGDWEYSGPSQWHQEQTSF